MVGVRLWRFGSRRRRRGEELDGDVVRVLDVEVRPELVVLETRVGDALLVEALLPAFELLPAVHMEADVVETDTCRVESFPGAGARVLACLRNPNMMDGDAQMVTGPCASSPDMITSASNKLL